MTTVLLLQLNPNTERTILTTACLKNSTAFIWQQGLFHHGPFQIYPPVFQQLWPIQFFFRTPQFIHFFSHAAIIQRPLNGIWLSRRQNPKVERNYGKNMRHKFLRQLPLMIMGMHHSLSVTFFKGFNRIWLRIGNAMQLCHHPPCLGYLAQKIFRKRNRRL